MTSQAVGERPPRIPDAAQQPVEPRLPGLQRRLFAPVDGASLAVFRIAFGLVLAWESFRYLQQDRIAPNWIEPDFYFTFWGFDWVRPWPGDGMYLHWWAIGLLGLLVAAGLFYRVSCVLLFAAMAYVFLLDKSWYLNHIYLVVLLAFVLTVVPAHRTWSLDAALGRAGAPAVPAWALWLVRAQVAVVYLGGGVAKLNGDWLRGEPLRAWLAERDDLFAIGRFFHEEWAPYLFSYGGLLLDLCVVPLLLWPRTRLLAFVAVASFHITNSQLFNIGIFPWLALGATTIFFPPDWPTRVWARLRRQAPAARPAVAAALRPPRPYVRRLLVGFLGVYLAFQLFMPLRHWLYPGTVHWTEEGHRFAWHMKLRDKEIVELEFVAVDPVTRRRELIVPASYLTGEQFDEMGNRPDMIRQFADHVADDFEKNGLPRPEVYVRALVKLNDHEPQLLVDPNRNMAEIADRPFAHADWIVPFKS